MSKIDLKIPTYQINFREEKELMDFVQLKHYLQLELKSEAYKKANQSLEETLIGVLKQPFQGSWDAQAGFIQHGLAKARLLRGEQ